MIPDPCAVALHVLSTPSRCLRLALPPSSLGGVRAAGDQRKVKREGWKQVESQCKVVQHETRKLGSEELLLVCLSYLWIQGFSLFEFFFSFLFLVSFSRDCRHAHMLAMVRNAGARESAAHSSGVSGRDRVAVPRHTSARE